jgi:AhpD family alkylhydroperoxidase
LLEPRRDAELESYARRKLGVPNPSLRYFAPVPWFARATIDTHPEFGLLIHLDQRVADLVALVVSQENSCRFCYAAARAFLWGRGMSRERIQRVEQDLSRADLPSRTLAAIAFARSQSRTGPVAAMEACAALQSAGYSRDEMLELMFVIASLDLMNRAHAIPAIPSQQMEAIPERLHMRLVWPLLMRKIRGRQSRGVPTPLPTVQDHPYAYQVNAFAGSPIAGVVNEICNGMWRSTHLSRRSKLLMLAVIARGLDCEACGRELMAALSREGISETVLTRVLAHLDAPELEPEERLLLQFARESIWFEPGSIQRRARTLRERLSEEQLLEAIGVVSVGNGFCRMGASIVSVA